MKNPKNHSLINRRDFVKNTALASIGIGMLGSVGIASAKPSCSKKIFELSLAQWSLHRSFFGGKLNALDFAKIAKQDFDISAIEYVNQFFKDKANDLHYLNDLKKRATDNGVKSLLIMIDGEGQLGDSDDAARNLAVSNHHKWVDAAAHLGCHSIRVNAGGNGDRKDLATAVVDGLGRLAQYGEKAGINVIVENHGGFSSDAAWLSGVIQQIGMENCGTLPDFGNFCIERGSDENGKRICVDEYDRYQGVAELMTAAKAVSAKSHDFDAKGNEIHTDYRRMMKIVMDAGYHGYVGVEYEGSIDDEATGIRKTRDLLIKVRKELSNT